MKKFLVGLMLLALTSVAQAQIIGALPYTLANGQVADANQVMSNFNYIVNSTNANAANGGINTNITALNALTTPITPAQGGTAVYIGGPSTNIGNAYTVGSPTPLGFTLLAGKTVCFIVSAGNTGPTTLNANSTGATNFYRQTATGPAPMVGGELSTSSVACAYYDGTQYQCTNCTTPSLVPTGTVVSFGGVNIPAGWIQAVGQAISRTTYSALFNVLSFTSVAATTTATSTTVNIASANTFIQVGWYVGGNNVTCNSTVSSVAASSIVISAAAGTSGSTTLTIGPYPQGDCSSTFNVPNFTGRVTAAIDTAGTTLHSTYCANAGSLGSICGSDSSTLAIANLPAYTPGGTITNGTITVNNTTTVIGGAGTYVPGGGSTGNPINPSATFTLSQATSTFAGTAQGGTDTPFTNLPPLGLVYKIIKL